MPANPEQHRAQLPSPLVVIAFIYPGYRSLQPDRIKSRPLTSPTGFRPMYRGYNSTPDEAECMTFEQSRQLQQKSHALIPGGAHTYAKGDDQFPQLAPAFIERGRGCHVWDVDGNQFIEYGSGLRAITLGHAHPRVVEAARKQMELGANFTRPSHLEVECAQAMIDMVGGEMVKFAKHGSDAVTAAVKLSRALTGRPLVAVCGDQPFFAVDDWFIGSTPMHSGIPDATRALTLKFRYNDLDSLTALLEQHKNLIACVIMEAETTDEPKPGYLQSVIDLCHRHGTVFVLDEMISGFRWHNAGAAGFHNIEPDLRTFGKAMGNGFSISALVGKRDIMKLGGLQHDQQRVFLMSTTHGGETHCLAAAIETMRLYRELDVVSRLWKQGERLKRGVLDAVKRQGVEKFFGVLGRPCNLLYYTLDPQGQRSQFYRALFLQELIRRGVLAPSFVVNYAHSDVDIDKTIDAIDGALVVYRKAIDEGVEKYLVGPPVKPVFRTHN